jgi:hypothetical protein
VEGAVTSFAACEPSSFFFFFFCEKPIHLCCFALATGEERDSKSPLQVLTRRGQIPPIFRYCVVPSFIHFFSFLFFFFFFFFLGLTNSLLTFSQEQNTLQTVCDGPDLVRGKDGG